MDIISYEAKRALLEVTKTSTDYWSNLSQLHLNESFKNASNVFKIQAQIGNTDRYEEKEVRISDGISKSNIIINIYDKSTFKTIKFNDNKYVPFLGQYFKMKDKSFEKTYMTISTDSDFNMYSSCIAKVCNQTIYMLDENKNLIEIKATFSDISQQGSSLVVKDDFTTVGALGALFLPVNDNTLKIQKDFRIFALQRHWKVAKVNTENTYLGDGIKQGLLNIRLVENYSDISADDQLMADRYNFGNTRPNIKFTYDKIISKSLNETFQLPITITKDGLPYTFTDIKYNLNDCHNVIRNGNDFKFTSYGEGAIQIHYSEYNFDEILTIKLVCVDNTSVSNITYRIDRENIVNDDFTVKRYQNKVYTCSKFINGILVNGDYDTTYTTNNLDLTKVIIDNTVADKISIKNNSAIEGSVTINFKDTTNNNTITSKVINMIR